MQRCVAGVEEWASRIGSGKKQACFQTEQEVGQGELQVNFKTKQEVERGELQMNFKTHLHLRETNRVRSKHASGLRSNKKNAS